MGREGDGLVRKTQKKDEDENLQGDYRRCKAMQGDYRRCKVTIGMQGKVTIGDARRCKAMQGDYRRCKAMQGDERR
jgi:hypothetical protein